MDDHFERQLAQLMRTTEERVPFHPEDRDRLHAGVRARRRTRAAQVGVGTLLAVGGIGLGLFLLPSAPDRVEPTAPRPAPVSGTTTVPDLTPSPALESGPTSSPSDTATTTSSSVPPPASYDGVVSFPPTSVTVSSPAGERGSDPPATGEATSSTTPPPTGTVSSGATSVSPSGSLGTD